MLEGISLVEVFFLVAGVLFSIGAILFKLGKMKPVFFPLPINPEVPVDWPYACWPLGIGSLLTYLGLITDDRTLGLVGLLGMIPSALILMAWKPRWLKPHWLHWLGENYSRPMREYMLEQAKRDKSWSHQVSTQEGLEAWANEMAQQYRSLTN